MNGGGCGHSNHAPPRPAWHRIRIGIRIATRFAMSYGRGGASPGPRRLLYGYDCPRGQSRGQFDIGLGALSPQPFQPSNVQWGQEGVSQRRHGPFLGVPARPGPAPPPGPTRSGQAVGAAVAARPVINDRFRLNIHTRPPTSSLARPGPARLSRRPRLGRPPGVPRSQAGTRR